MTKGRVVFLWFVQALCKIFFSFKISCLELFRVTRYLRISANKMLDKLTTRNWHGFVFQISSDSTKLEIRIQWVRSSPSQANERLIRIPLKAVFTTQTALPLSLGKQSNQTSKTDWELNTGLSPRLVTWPQNMDHFKIEVTFNSFSEWIFIPLEKLYGMWGGEHKFFILHWNHLRPFSVDQINVCRSRRLRLERLVRWVVPASHSLNSLTGNKNIPIGGVYNSRA